MRNKKGLLGIIVLFVLFVLLFSSCFSQSLEQQPIIEGLDNWDSNLSSVSITSSLFLEREFLTDYPYKSGNFYFHYYGSLFSYNVDKSFVWLSYDQPEVYLNAKESRFESRRSDILDYSLDGTEAFGFTFYLTYDFQDEGKSCFPRWFTAFGFNDETQTLVFIGIYFSYTLEEDKQYVEHFETNFSAFLTHYYGDWFDWEAGVGYTAPSDGGE